MLIERKDNGTWTDIICYANGVKEPWSAYRITCMDYEVTSDGERVLPVVRISLLTTTNATIETTRLLAKEYAEVADLAEQLQNEKRAAYAARFAD